MRLLAFFVFGIGIALAGGGVYFVGEFLKAERASTANIEAPTVRVLAAGQPLAPDTLLGAAHLEWVEWPSWAVPEGAYTSTEALFGEKHDQKRYVMRSIEPGEPILRGKISEFGRFNVRIPPGKSAVSIRIDAVSGVSGFVGPGDHVDILLTRSQGGQIASSVTLRDVLVMAIDQTNNTEAGSPRVGRTATVAVTTGEAQTLAVAQQLGHLSLILRGPNDGGDDASPPVTDDDLNDLLKDDGGKTIIINRGGTKERIRVD